MQQPVSIAGMSWYEADSYQQIRTLMKDGHTLPATFESFLAKAESTEDRLKREGHRVVRAIIRPGEFEAWCSARGMDVDSKGRTAFANWTAMQVHRNNH